MKKYSYCYIAIYLRKIKISYYSSFKLFLDNLNVRFPSCGTNVEVYAMANGKEREATKEDIERISDKLSPVTEITTSPMAALELSPTDYNFDDNSPFGRLE